MSVVVGGVLIRGPGWISSNLVVRGLTQKLDEEAGSAFVLRNAANDSFLSRHCLVLNKVLEEQ
jgi:hypothetical protein